MNRITRLKKRREFLDVAATRQKWVTPGLILQVKKKDVEDGIRVGFTTSKKVGSAVERNRARRRLRALAAEILPVHAKSGFDFVIIGRRATLTRPWQNLQKDLLWALKKLNAKQPQA